MDESNNKKKVRSKIIQLTIICIICVVVIVVIIFVTKMKNENSSISSDSISEIDPSRPFANLSEEDIKSVFVYKSWYKSTADNNKHTLSTDEIRQLLEMLIPIRINPEKGKEMQIYLGGSNLFYIELVNGKMITVGAHAGYGLFFYNGMEYECDYKNCKSIDDYCVKLENE